MAAPTENLYSYNFDAEGEVTTNTIYATGFTWTGATDAAHQLTFKNSAGNILFGPYTAGLVGAVIHIPFPGIPKRCVGLEANVLGSGVVEVYKA